MEPIEFWAIVNKVQTMADGGIRVTLDLPETALVAMAEMAACKIGGKVLDVMCRERKADGDGDDAGHRKIHI